MSSGWGGIDIGGVLVQPEQVRPPAEGRTAGGHSPTL